MRQETVLEDDEPLFVDDMSDFDMDEILAGTQRQIETAAGETRINGMAAGGTNKDDAAKSVDRDEFEDEIDAMNDVDDF